MHWQSHGRLFKKAEVERERWAALGIPEVDDYDAFACVVEYDVGGLVRRFLRVR
jgi:hypothetical protein